MSFNLKHQSGNREDHHDVAMWFTHARLAWYHFTIAAAPSRKEEGQHSGDSGMLSHRIILYLFLILSVISSAICSHLERGAERYWKVK